MRRVLAGFLILMAVLTVLSRALDSVTVTRVKVGYGKQGTVTHLVEGEGKFEADSIAYISLPEDMLVEKLQRQPGEPVRAGETVLTLQAERLQEVRDGQADACRKAELALEEERLSARTYPRVTQELLAGQQLEADERALEVGRQDLAQAQEECALSLDELRREYDRKANRSEDEIREEARRAVKSAGRSYDAARLDREQAVKEAERTVRDKQKKLDRLEQQEASEEALEEAAEELLRAEEDLDEVREAKDLLVEEAKAALRAAEEDYDDRDYDSVQRKEELEQEYKERVKAEEDKLKAAERQVRQLEETVRQSAQRLENARINDAGVVSEEETRREISRLRQESLALDLERARKELARTEALIAGGGAVMAPVDGIVAGMDARAGEQTIRGDQIRLATGSLTFRALVEKEDATLLRGGIPMSVKRNGVADELRMEVESVSRMAENEEATVAATVPDGEGKLGETADFSIVLESETYPTVIPIEALREDQKGFFCLAVEPQKTILGEELKAVRVDVTVLEKGDAKAAVSGAIGPDTRLIVSSNKGVAPGDRVRVVTE